MAKPHIIVSIKLGIIYVVISFPLQKVIFNLSGILQYLYTTEIMVSKSTYK